MTKKKKIALISLGCEKNLVDSESILGIFDQNKYLIINDLNEADAIIINTCGFIVSAKEEAINTIFDCLEYQKNGTKIIVTGCLVQRYYDDLVKDIPEVDLYVPIRDYYKIGLLLEDLLLDKFEHHCLSLLNRVISTPKHLAYVRISDGCNNRCAYCAIPLIRGEFKSRDPQEIIDEVKYLVKTNRKEICLISQDLTRYGQDLTNYSLSKLLKELVKIPGDYVIRLLYLYPDEITDELIQVIKDNDKIINYFDIPIQHASNKILKWMNRRGDKMFIKNLINKIRFLIPDSVIRTTIIVGFPHETEKDHQELLEFIKEMKFDHLGAFTYSKEEDTASYTMTAQVPKRLKEKRFNEVMETQKWISLKQNEKYLNNIYDCIIESYNEENNEYLGRIYAYAPDDIDGQVIIPCDDKDKENITISSVVKVKIIDIDFYDIIGKIIN